MEQGTTRSFLPATTHWQNKFRKSAPMIRASTVKRFIATSTEKSLAFSKKRLFRTAEYPISGLTPE